MSRVAMLKRISRSDCHTGGQRDDPVTAVGSRDALNDTVVQQGADGARRGVLVHVQTLGEFAYATLRNAIAVDVGLGE